MKIQIWIGLMVMALFLGISQWAANGETDFFEHSEERSRPEVKPVQNELYAKECGACHFAYQSGLLPAASWEGIMTNLADHFGDNAEMGNKEEQTIIAYLRANAADHAREKRSVKIARSIKGRTTPLRISELPYIVRQHDEIPERLIRGNADVGSLSNCTACHTQAEKGIYEEDTVRIPGVGKWDD